MLLCSKLFFILGFSLKIACALCPCGKRRLGSDSKIVGGNLSRENAWPWMAGLVQILSGRQEQFCGASLVDSRNVLTAAHCVHDLVVRNASLVNFRVVMGDTKLDGSNIVRYGIDAVKIHPSYNPETLVNDIALVHLSSKVKYSQSVQPICIHQPSGQPLTPGLPAVVVGWGAVRDGGPTVNSQRQVALRISPPGLCKSNYGKVGIDINPARMVCAASDKKDSCAGDSGGPLFLKRKQEQSYEQIGIVSFGRHCAQKGFPGIYTRISPFINFIQRNTENAGRC